MRGERTAEILWEIQQERHEQDLKWGEQNHTVFVWIGILGEEFGEVCRGAVEDVIMRKNDDGNYLKAYRAELVHVAAVAVAAIEALDRRNFGMGPPAAAAIEALDRRRSAMGPPAELPREKTLTQYWAEMCKSMDPRRPIIDPPAAAPIEKKELPPPYKELPLYWGEIIRKKHERENATAHVRDRSEAEGT